MTWDDEILGAMKPGIPITITDISSAIADLHPTYFKSTLMAKIHAHMTSLEKYGIVERAGKDKYGYRVLWRRK